MQFIFIGIFGFIISINAQAADLKIITGKISSSCSSSDSELLLAAQNEANLRAGSENIRASDWYQRAFNIGWDYMPEACKYRGAWASALYVQKTEKNELYFLTTDLGISNPRKDQDIPGDGKMTDTEAWEKAVEENQSYALRFCRQIGKPIVLSKSKKIFNGRLWYDYFAVKVRFQCIL